MFVLVHPPPNLSIHVTAVLPRLYHFSYRRGYKGLFEFESASIFMGLSVSHLDIVAIEISRG